MNEELIFDYLQENPAYFKRFGERNPEQIVLIHFNGRGRDPNFRLEKFFAGHWVYHPGCLLTQDISADDAVISVEDGSLFKTGFGRLKYKKNDDVVLVPMDEQGNKIWAEAEQTTIVSIDGDTLELERGKFGTEARAFAAGNTYVAPHMVEGPWGDETNNLMWYYNFSSVCPKDADGKTAGDILAEEIAEWLREGGELDGFNGIQFDIAPWSLHHSPWDRTADIDADGTPDFGKIDGLNTYGIGVYRFYETLRSLLGDQKIIVADGNIEYSQRAVGVLNGMEAEGLSDWGKIHEEFSKPLSLFSYWKKNAKYPEFSYITHKDRYEGGQRSHRERLVIGTAQCLGLALNSFRNIEQPGHMFGLPDELVKGVENQTHWLGKPLGDMLQLALSSEDLLGGKGISFFEDAIETVGCAVSVEDGSIIVEATGEKPKMSIRLQGLELPKGDTIIYFESKARDSLAGFDPIVPRQIFVSLPGSIPNKDTAEEVLNYTGTNDYYPCAFYFREAGASTCDVEIVIEGGGQVELRNFKLFNKAQAICREFENGVVLVNPSLSPYAFDLEALYPGQNFKRLTTTSYNRESVNDGSKASGSVAVPPLDGLFLIKE